MKKIFNTLTIICLTTSLFAQTDFNLSLVSKLSYEESSNDVWGFVDTHGNEYAIIGTKTATRVISLADPSNPIEVATINGVSTTWRDIKAKGNFIYGIADGRNTAEGLLVIDMSDAPDNISHQFLYPEIIINGDTTLLEACHNIYFDENGYGYIAGCNVNNGGVLFFDFFTDPANPTFIAAGDPRYSHDVFVRGDTMWSSDINQDFFSVSDISDKHNPILLATQITTSSFTHNAWLSDDGHFLFTTDELPNSFVDAYNVSDITDIQLFDSYQPAPTLGTGVVPHNVHYYNGYLVISYYSDGVKIVDAHKADNLIEVASYDTYPINQTGTNGCWGTYPYLPSGLVLASDIEFGLFVLQPDYKRACYLEGNIRDEESNQQLGEVEIKILSNKINIDISNSFGDYKTGQVDAGNFMVEFSLAGYESKTLAATLVNGEVTMLDVKLKALPRFQFAGVTIEDENELAIEDVTVMLESKDFTYKTTSNQFGNFEFEEVIQGTYNIYIGKWGHENIVLHQNINQAGSAIARLKIGYRDDFIVDQGWTIEGNANTGAWEIAKPLGTRFNGKFSNPNTDIDNDLGDFCYVTGNREGSVGFDDVDEGNTILISPKIDLSNYTEPVISYYYWFFNESGAKLPNDSLLIYLSDGVDTVGVDTIIQSSSQWSEKQELIIADYFASADTVQIFFETADQRGLGNLLECGIDFFLVSNASPSSTFALINPNLTINATPNPFDNQVNINFEIPNFQKNTQLVISNILGQQIKSIPIQQQTGKIILGEEWNTGIYFVQLFQNEKVSKTLKIIKAK